MEPEKTTKDDWVFHPTVESADRDSAQPQSPTVPESEESRGSAADSPRAKSKSKSKARRDSSEEPLPERLGRFLVVRRLGRGGMGVVLEAYDETLDRKVAVKQLHEDAGRSHRKRLVREAQALARLSHPNVVQIYDAGEHAGRLFIAMELVAGKTLWDWQKKPRAWSECLRVYTAAANGLLAAHEQGIIHRDFKPTNCIIGDDGAVKVLDFGLARGVDDLDDPELEGRMETLDPDASPRATTGPHQTLAESQLDAPANAEPEESAEPGSILPARPLEPNGTIDDPDVRPGSEHGAEEGSPLGFDLSDAPERATADSGLDDPSGGEPDTVRRIAAQRRRASGSMPSASGSTRALSIRLTRTGALLGTPAYMAPEQALGEPSDARSDQFSLCVAMFEALYGERPYGKQPALAMLAESAAELRAPAARQGLPAVPRWLHAVLKRGLSARKEDRFATMGGFLEALRHGQRRRRNVSIAALGVVGLVGVAAIASTRDAPCEGLRDASMPAWTQTQREGVEEAIIAGAGERGPSVWAATERALDHYEHAWSDARAAACEATHVEHVASAALLERRIECLDGRARRMKATVALLATADRHVATRAAQAVRSLPAVEPCLDGQRLHSAAVLPASLDDEAAPIRDLIAQSWAFDAAGRAAQGLDAAQSAVVDAESLGESAAVLVAEARHNRGRLYRAVGRFGEARDDLQAVLEFAERSDDEGLAMEALRELLGVALDEADRSASAAWMSVVAGKLRRYGEDHPRDHAELLSLQGLIALHDERYEDAAAVLGTAVEELAKLGSEATLRHCEAWLRLGMAQGHLGHDEPAMAAFDEALALAEQEGLLPLQATILHERGRFHDEQGRADEAEKALTQALALRVAFDGEAAPITISTRTLLARLAAQRGDLDAAHTLADAARASLGPTVSANRRAQVMTLLASLERERGNWDAAADHYRSAREAWMSSPSPDEIELAMLEASVADCLLMAERYEPAREHYEAALAILDLRVPSDDPRRVFPLLGLGHLLFEQGQIEGSVAVYHRAWAIQKDATDNAEMTAIVRWELARAVLSSVTRTEELRDEALAHVAAAREHYQSIGDEGWVSEIDAYMNSCGARCEAAVTPSSKQAKEETR